MPRFSDYQELSNISDSDVFLAETKNGTRKISAYNLSNELTKYIDKEHYFKSMDRIASSDTDISAKIRNNIYRGDSLGTSITTAQWNSIDAGYFDNMFLGDFWVFSGHIFRIVDFDYWFFKGDTKCYTHHVVLMPDEYTTVPYSTMDEDGGKKEYVSSLLRTETLYGENGVDVNAISILGYWFGNHFLNHREYFQNTFQNNAPVNGIWVSSSIELPSEVMIYGYCSHFPSNGINPTDRKTSSSTQLSAFRLNPALINTRSDSDSYWLRDYCGMDASGNSYFSCVDEYGLAGYKKSSVSLNIRPVFAICKQN